jgi:hypothetical protein
MRFDVEPTNRRAKGLVDFLDSGRVLPISSVPIRRNLARDVKALLQNLPELLGGLKRKQLVSRDQEIIDKL